MTIALGAVSSVMRMPRTRQRAGAFKRWSALELGVVNAPAETMTSVLTNPILAVGFTDFFLLTTWIGTVGDYSIDLFICEPSTGAYIPPALFTVGGPGPAADQTTGDPFGSVGSGLAFITLHTFAIQWSINSSDPGSTISATLLGFA